MSKVLTNEEVLATFCSWLADRRGALEVGESHDAAELFGLLALFIEWNDLESGDPVGIEGCYIPPLLWYRYTPALGEIEWWLRKKYRDTVAAIRQLFGDIHTCP